MIEQADPARFANDDERARAAHPRLDAFYRANWLDLTGIERHDDSTERGLFMQRHEVDVTLHLQPGWWVNIEEKVTTGARRYRDIVLLERWSSVPYGGYRGSPGWAWRTDLECDFLNYTWTVHGQALLIPYRPLRSILHSDVGLRWQEWAHGRMHGLYSVRRRNRAKGGKVYITESVMVPLRLLMEATGGEMRAF